MKYVPISLFQYVFDASSLINIERQRRMKHLRKRYSEIIMPEQVAKEVNTPRTPLQRFLKHYPSVITHLLSNEETLYLKILGQLGIHKGEAAAITIAISRKLPLVIDESTKKARGKAENHGIQCLTSQDFIQKV